MDEFVGTSGLVNDLSAFVRYGMKRIHNKRDNIHITYIRGAVVQQLLRWKDNEYYIF